MTSKKDAEIKASWLECVDDLPLHYIIEDFVRKVNYNQTLDERDEKQTKYENYKGFTDCPNNRTELWKNKPEF